MSTTTDVVRENAAYHAQLLAAVAELDYIPSAVEQQDSYIAGLENQLRLLGPKIASLEMQTKKEREEHEALRDSATRRFAATITGRKDKYEAKASKEEREYVEALEKEMQHKRQQGALETMIREAKTLRRDLQSKLERYNKAKQDLTTLYSKIFDGPTQAFPEDDQLEYQLQQAQDRYNEIQGYLNRESQAVNLLQSAYDALQSCYSQMKEAIDDSHWDMFGGFGAVDDIMERQDLRAAQEKATQAQMFVQQAMMISPQVQPVGEITIAQGSLVTDVFFDNIFTDMAFHQKIIASKRNVQDVQINVMNQLRFAQGRAGAIGADLNVAADALAHARGELDAFRRRVFDGMAGNGHGDENKHVPPLPAPAGPPPGYSATEAGPPSQVSGPSSSFTPPPGQPLSLPSQIPMITNSYAPPPGPPPPGSRAVLSFSLERPLCSAPASGLSCERARASWQ
ncbi:hypothetical protein MVEN_00314900 [Mycena venus]|uniref:Uncharacterized protein n=1 Tax=Mycena venus TaxID=2733690 RepID=A0A8H7DCY3_9AGAR|nr:hypothetical protein MVEN_00314900 [Mycena venus]